MKNLNSLVLRKNYYYYFSLFSFFSDIFVVFVMLNHSLKLYTCYMCA